MLDLSVPEGITPRMIADAWDAYLDRLLAENCIGTRVAEYAVWVDGFARGWTAARETDR